jgi:hypothetical protein
VDREPGRGGRHRGADCRQQNRDEGEELEIVLMLMDEVLAMILGSEIIDGSLQLGVLLAIQKGLLPVGGHYA